MKIRVSLGSTLAQAVLAELASGTGSDPKLEVYTGIMPASIGAAITDTLLASFDLDSAVGSESNGVITLSGWTDVVSAPATGIPGWARIVNKSGDEVMLLSAGPSGSGKSVTVSPETIAAGEPVNLTSGVIRMPV